MLQRARAAGVSHFVTVGCDPQGIARARGLAAIHADVWCTVGIHPHNAADVSDSFLDGLEAQFADPRVVAVGECGLDYYYDHSPRARQREVLARQVALAKKVRKPLMIHVRDAYPDVADVLAAEGARDVGGIIHCFSGSWDFARLAMDMDFDLSIPGVVTFAKPGDLPQVVAQAPLERLLTETDSPYLAPIPHRGKRNEPAFVACVAAKLAEIRGMSATQMAQITAQNTVKRLALV